MNEDVKEPGEVPATSAAPAPGPSPEQVLRRRVRSLALLVRDLCVATLVLLVLGVFLVQPFRVEGSSMEPLLHTGEKILVDKLSYRTSDIERFDVVVLESPEGRAIIKRVVALPGETVEITRGAVLVDGVALDEAFLDLANRSSESRPPIRLGPEQYFVLGDNRSVSVDSRRFGAVRRESIRGRAAWRYWPFDEAGRLEEPAAP